jgi:hypothetical protein
MCVGFRETRTSGGRIGDKGLGTEAARQMSGEWVTAVIDASRSLHMLDHLDDSRSPDLIFLRMVWFAGEASLAQLRGEQELARGQRCAIGLSRP